GWPIPTGSQAATKRRRDETRGRGRQTFHGPCLSQGKIWPSELVCFLPGNGHFMTHRLMMHRLAQYACREHTLRASLPRPKLADWRLSNIGRRVGKAFAKKEAASLSTALNGLRLTSGLSSRRVKSSC